MRAWRWSPVAACGDETCVNHGVNVFEHSGRYKSQARDRAKCRECNTTFRLGEAAQLWRTLDEPGQLENRLADVFWHMRKGKGIRYGLEEFEQRFEPTVVRLCPGKEWTEASAPPCRPWTRPA